MPEETKLKRFQIVFVLADRSLSLDLGTLSGQEGIFFLVGRDSSSYGIEIGNQSTIT